jgi:hypothetical protein
MSTSKKYLIVPFPNAPPPRPRGKNRLFFTFFAWAVLLSARRTGGVKGARF